MTVLKQHNGTGWETIAVGGPGVPPGGTAVQALAKKSSTNYDTKWSTVLTQTVGDGRYLEQAGDTATGPLILNAAPTAPLQIATKAYVDSYSGVVTAWNPTIAGLTKGNGVGGGFYLKQGRTCHFAFGFQLGSTSEVTAGLTFPLPFDALGWGAWGFGYAGDQSTQLSYPFTVMMNTKTNANLATFGYGTNYSNFRDFSAIVPFDWTVNDHLQFEMNYITAT